MSSIRTSPNWHLSTARFELAIPRRTRVRRLALGLLAIALLAAAVLWRTESLQQALPLPGSRPDRARLESDVARLQAELALERATRASLNRQIADLNSRNAELRSQVDFLTAQKAPTK